MNKKFQVRASGVAFWQLHRAPLVPSPSRWAPDDHGRDEVCDVWYLLEDLLWHGT